MLTKIRVVVTKEEPAWESFSESEPEVAAPAAKKAKTAPAAGKAAPAGGKKGGGGQGSIMSFFSKK